MYTHQGMEQVDTLDRLKTGNFLRKKCKIFLLLVTKKLAERTTRFFFKDKKTPKNNLYDIFRAPED